MLLKDWYLVFKCNLCEAASLIYFVICIYHSWELINLYGNCFPENVYARIVNYKIALTYKVWKNCDSEKSNSRGNVSTNDSLCLLCDYLFKWHHWVKALLLYHVIALLYVYVYMYMYIYIYIYINVMVIIKQGSK